jgi:8-hydroxy-5-deazaflavin:NADPH oxidoreductase
MKIGILGTGDVGKALARGFISRGHDVMLGSREAGNEKAAAFVKETGGKAKAGTFAEAAAHGEIVVLCTLWSGTENALSLAGQENLAGKVLIDTTNPLDFSQGMPPRLAIGHTDSAGESVQRWAPKARVVKCWNIIGNADMVDPTFPTATPTMFICGNDADAKKSAHGILESFGWTDVVDLGGIDNSRLLEPLCILWVKYGVSSGGWRHGLAMLKK